MPETQIGTQTEKNTARLEAFSDGVFAIAITLLVLELKVPHLASGALEPTPRALVESLVAEWPSYFSFITSFFSILIMWVHHHTLFRLARQTDATLLFANGLLLMMISVVPYPTAVVAEYFGTADSDVACEFYCGVFLLVSLAFYLLLLATLREHVRMPDAPPSVMKRLRRNYAMGPPAYLLAGLAALWSPLVSLLICTGLWILWAVMTREECSTNDEIA